MTAKTLKYSHELICPASNAPQEKKVKQIKKEEAKQPVACVETTPMPLLRCQILRNTLNARQDKMNQKKDMFNNVLVNAL